MSAQTPPPGPGSGEPELTEEQLRQLDAEIERIHVDDVILQTIVSLINLGARKGAVGAPPEANLQPDYEQLKIAIDAAQALINVVELRHADKLNPFRDALAQLKMAYARGSGGAAAAPAPAAPGAAEPQGGQGGTGSAPGGGRLWVPGQ
jgi:hypothetical protein